MPKLKVGGWEDNDAHSEIYLLDMGGKGLAKISQSVFVHKETDEVHIEETWLLYSILAHTGYWEPLDPERKIPETLEAYCDSWADKPYPGGCAQA